MRAVVSSRCRCWQSNPLDPEVLENVLNPMMQRLTSPRPLTLSTTAATGKTDRTPPGSPRLTVSTAANVKTAPTPVSDVSRVLQGYRSPTMASRGKTGAAIQYRRSTGRPPLDDGSTGIAMLPPIVTSPPSASSQAVTATLAASLASASQQGSSLQPLSLLQPLSSGRWEGSAANAPGLGMAVGGVSVDAGVVVPSRVGITGRLGDDISDVSGGSVTSEQRRHRAGSGNGTVRRSGSATPYRSSIGTDDLDDAMALAASAVAISRNASSTNVPVTVSPRLFDADNIPRGKTVDLVVSLLKVRRA